MRRTIPCQRAQINVKIHPVYKKYKIIDIHVDKKGVPSRAPLAFLLSAVGISRGNLPAGALPDMFWYETGRRKRRIDIVPTLVAPKLVDAG